MILLLGGEEVPREFHIHSGDSGRNGSIAEIIDFVVMLPF
jgi:hypothetical protein